MASAAARPEFRVHISVAVIEAGRILLVQEQKAIIHKLWNLPGGHLDHDEVPEIGARRELLEETHLDLPMRALLGIYPHYNNIRFVYLADNTGQAPTAGDEILAVRWLTPEEILASPDAELVSAANLKHLVRDYLAGQSFARCIIRPRPR